jgi:hypothetical protein
MEGETRRRDGAQNEWNKERKGSRNPGEQLERRRGKKGRKIAECRSRKK